MTRKRLTHKEYFRVAKAVEKDFKGKKEITHTVKDLAEHYSRHFDCNVTVGCMRDMLDEAGIVPKHRSKNATLSSRVTQLEETVLEILKRLEYVST